MTDSDHSPDQTAARGVLYTGEELGCGLPEDHRLLGAMIGGRRRWLARAMAVVLVGAALGAVSALNVRYLARLWRAEIDVWGRPQRMATENRRDSRPDIGSRGGVVSLPESMARESMAREMADIDHGGASALSLVAAERSASSRSIDWRRVHGLLMPRWLIARGHADRDRGRHTLPSVDAASLAHRQFVELRFAVRDDPTLVAILDELEPMATAPENHAERVDYLLWAWNAHLDRRRVPWRLEANLHLRRDGTASFVTRSYEVLADLRDPEGRRLRLMRRADLTNVDEGFLGHSPGREEGALVILDETLRFAVQSVWPMLHPSLDPRLAPEARAVAPEVRARVRLAALDRARLRDTAVDQLALVEVAASIHARASCGNRFRVWGLPWNGLAPPDQNALVGALGRSRGRDCPEVTLGEAARMIGASERLGQTPALAGAVESLGAWVARAIAIHELRHVADEQGGPNAEGVECPGCPPSMKPATRAELSAYLASLAVDEVAHVSLLQACAMHPEDHAHHEQPHARALAFLLPRLLDSGCAGRVPSDLARRARHLERALFGQRAPILLPEDFPATIEILARK